MSEATELRISEGGETREFSSGTERVERSD